MSISFLLLAACTGTTGTPGGEVANYTLSLVPITPPDHNPFENADRIDLLLDIGTGDPVRVTLAVPDSDESVEADALPALDGTRLVVEVYDEGELVGWGESVPLTATEGEIEATVFITVPETLVRLGSLPEEMALGAGVALGSGRFVLMGGAGNNNKPVDRSLDGVWLLDLGAPAPELAFQEVGTMPEYVDSEGNTVTKRRDFTLTRLTAGDAGQYLLVGGADGHGYKEPQAMTAEARLFDPETLTFADPIADKDALSVGRTMHAAIANQQGGVLVWGGYGSAPERYYSWLQYGELYDPVDRSFSDVPRDAKDRDVTAGSIAVGLAEVGTDGVLVAGGYHFDANGDWLVSDSSFLVSFAGDISEVSAFSPVFAHAMVTLQNGDVLAFGGMEGTRTANSLTPTGTATDLVQRYDAKAKQWETAGEMKFARGGHTATLLDERFVLIAGGATTWNRDEFEEDSANSCVEIYDTEAHTSVTLNDCTANDDAGGLAAPSQAPIALFDPEIGVLFAGGIDGSNGAHATTTFYGRGHSD